MEKGYVHVVREMAVASGFTPAGGKPVPSSSTGHVVCWSDRAGGKPKKATAETFNATEFGYLPR